MEIQMATKTCVRGVWYPHLRSLSPVTAKLRNLQNSKHQPQILSANKKIEIELTKLNMPYGLPGRT